ncbi:hypothetical protein K458DRAFT_322749 [Lentithecium fluviatile CBS 122367]|uniref:non-specific serine/threonine protein kinase n=1 Tax=Lentithecium fluviatile CBS 122367 TaxID=1168545 RepID=A0A6G1IDT2_9PLEO|nr:hypothetical protein K458DRAFT_322749 [Lentithecium fluviatile CBS 122367]
MSSARYAQPAAASIPHQAAYRAPAAVSHAPPGTFASGTKVQVGNHRVTIEKYLSEGGFAHVYLVRVPKNNDGTPEVAVLKRVAVPDKDALANMRTEVETMKKLKGHKHIVTYIDSHASQLKGGGYEVFLLMEFCSGGGLIDFMNTRLQHRLTEPEILHIFSDVAEGVATMHYLKPPLLHRDLKVENVLITTVGTTRVYKLCDFGSTAPPRPAAKTAAEGRLIEDDVQRHTTLQYRSPEMIDVYRKQPIDEKSDIWALGVLLYKLCYYTTPFEEVGQMAILNATFKFPAYPQFSDRLKKLISSMLQESPQRRPNIYQVVVEVCSMRHRSVPIKDIYSNRTQSEDRRNQQLPSPDTQVSSPPIIGLQKVAPVQKVQPIPDITPMRRGRPAVPLQQPPAAKPSPSPMRGAATDPFAALDSNNVDVRRAAADELAARFPSLDEFSLLHDRGQKFEFDQTPVSSDPQLSKRVTQALADDAFNVPPTKIESAPQTKTSSAAPSAGVSRSASVKKPQRFDGAKDSPRSAQPPIAQPAPQRPNMVSTGIQTSPSPSPVPVAAPQKYVDVNKRPIWRVPDTTSQHSRTMSQPRAFEKPQPSPSSLKPEFALPTRPSLLDSTRSRSHTSTLSIPKSPASSRPSLESSRPSALDLGTALDRSKSAQSHGRPTSIHVESNLDFLREREAAPGRSFDAPSRLRGPPSGAVADSDSETDGKNITSNVGFLRAMEHDDSSHKKHRRSSSQSKHTKRASLSSITSNTKNIVKGRFGDAFRKFESNSPNMGDRGRTEQPLTPTDHLIDSRGKALTPIAGSEATGGTSDDERTIDETQDLPPEVRRELERRRLSQEERRVEAAAAEYRQRLAAEGKGKAGPTRASTIQNRVKNLLDESQKQTPANRTAEGYGKYTDTGKPLPTRPQEQTSMKPPPAIARKPIALPQHSTQQAPPDLAYAKPRPNIALPPTSSSAPPAAQRPTTNQTGPRPPPPSKPKALRTGGASDFSSAGKQSPVVGSVTGVRDRPSPAVASAQQDGPPDDGNEWDMDSFSKRYPSLSGLEMVETEIPARGGATLRGGIREI